MHVCGAIAMGLLYRGWASEGDLPEEVMTLSCLFDLDLRDNGLSGECESEIGFRRRCVRSRLPPLSCQTINDFSPISLGACSGCGSSCL